MISAQSGARALFNSLAGRLTALLTCGVVGASLSSLLIAEHAHVRDYHRARLQRVVDSTVDIARRLAADPEGTKRLLKSDGIFGAHAAPATRENAPRQAELDALLTARLGAGAQVRSSMLAAEDCFPGLHFKTRAAGLPEEALPACADIRFIDANGAPQGLSIDVAPSTVPPSSLLDPRYLLPLLAAAAVMSFLIARLVTAPLRRLTRAAHAFSVTVDPETIPETGPRETRAALATFNLMQQRVREGFRERTQILAAITHDLQTPLTRLRLRVEQVADDAVRAKLIADMVVMQQLVRGGLDLARSGESREGWVLVDIDSVLSSIAEDTAEMGHDASFVGGCGIHARVKPDALTRCLNNLVDNAVRHGGDAKLSCARNGRTLEVVVRDHGPGLDEAAIGLAMQPFSRPAGSAGDVSGSGLGLAIAKAQARTFGVELRLAGHEGGGLVATVIIPLTMV